MQILSKELFLSAGVPLIRQYGDAFSDHLQQLSPVGEGFPAAQLRCT